MNCTYWLNQTNYKYPLTEFIKEKLLLSIYKEHILTCPPEVVWACFPDVFQNQ